eukprot:TRINITY_DN0_c1_g3_i1.p1 TRINITY_DN0_c1_g3~~TRINITY_DN0_c1_g3_i1.p1  ORF type:complete len:359 (+),score=66.40 TRINITY_DN0_c1_g3_i1:1689-2765(+)
MPFSSVETCRIGGNPGWEAFCGGPCPDYKFRHDMRPENPVATWQRGSYQTIHYSKNNHEGGFVRVALVPLDERMRVEAHDALAFHYGCWSTGQYYCDAKQKHRDCGFDLDNLAYKMTVRVPTTHPDGVYVLGWTWYGGGTVSSDFGDYYDCAFVRIQGGELSDSYQAVFEPGPERHDSCIASVNRLGLCVSEPCFDSDGHKYAAGEKVPAPFEGGRAPLIYREWLERAQARAANRPRVAADAHEFGITAFSIYDTGNERKLQVDTDEFIDVSGIDGITIVPEYFGDVQWVEWVVNGEKESERHDWPFSIGGEQPHGDGHNFYDWPYPLLDKRVFVTAIAHSHGRVQFFSKDLYFSKQW